MIKTVIFDLDGTLTEFKLDVKACRAEVIQHLTKQDLPREFFSLNESAFDMILKVKKHLESKASEQKFLDIQKMVFSIVERHELQAAKTTKMFFGIQETLEELKKMNLSMGLCTLSGKKATGYILKKFKISNYFDAVFPRESVLFVKPHPAHLQAVLDALQVDSQEAVLVGDSIKDIMCANHLEVLSVGATTGLSSMAQLTNSGAHYIVSSANEMPKLIQQLNT